MVTGKKWVLEKFWPEISGTFVMGHNVSFSGDVVSWSPQLFQVSVSNVETGVSQFRKALN